MQTEAYQHSIERSCRTSGTWSRTLFDIGGGGFSETLALGSESRPRTSRGRQRNARRRDRLLRPRARPPTVPPLAPRAASAVKAVVSPASKRAREQDAWCEMLASWLGRLTGVARRD